MEKKETKEKTMKKITPKMTSLEEFLNTAKEFKPKFTASIDMEIALNIKKESIQGSLLLPKAFPSKKHKVVFFSNESFTSKYENLIKGEVTAIKNKKILPKYTIATKDSFKEIRPLAKVLGPRNCFPNPKNGTLVLSHESGLKLSEEYASGQRKNYKTDVKGYIKMSIGNLNMTLEELRIQLKALRDHFNTNHGNSPIKSLSLSSTMLKGSFKVI